MTQKAAYTHFLEDLPIVPPEYHNDDERSLFTKLYVPNENFNPCPTIKNSSDYSEHTIEISRLVDIGLIRNPLITTSTVECSPTGATKLYLRISDLKEGYEIVKNNDDWSKTIWNIKFHNGSKNFSVDFLFEHEIQVLLYLTEYLKQINNSITIYSEDEYSIHREVFYIYKRKPETKIVHKLPQRKVIVNFNVLSALGLINIKTKRILDNRYDSRIKMVITPTDDLLVLSEAISKMYTSPVEEYYKE